MTDYYVEWRIEIDADSPEEAAQKAESFMKTRFNRVFHVYESDGGFDPEHIDLDEIEQEAH